jgi:threonine/homoserine/homoserine lactone efflux protein
MPEVPKIGMFVVASLVLLVSPGPAVLYVVTRSMNRGRIAGIVSSLGLCAGNVVQLAGIALGLSAILISSEVAFNIVKFMGAGYIIYLGVRRLLEREEHHASGRVCADGRGKIFLQGVVINLLNPKTAVFAVAFLPQFVSPAADDATYQLFMLGLLFNTLAVFVGICYALLGGILGDWLRSYGGFVRAQRYLTGALLIVIAIATVFMSVQG